MKELESKNSVFFRNPEVTAYYEYNPEQKTLTYHYYAEPSETWFAHSYFGDSKEKQRMLSKELATIIYYDIDTVEEATTLIYKIGEMCCGEPEVAYEGRSLTLFTVDLDVNYRLCRLRKGEEADLRLHAIPTKLVLAKNVKNSHYIITVQDKKIKSYRFILNDHNDMLSRYLTETLLVHIQHNFIYKHGPTPCDVLRLRITTITLDYAFGDAFRYNPDHALYTAGVPTQLEVTPVTNDIYYRTAYDRYKILSCGILYMEQLRLYSRLLQPEDGEQVTLVKRVIRLRVASAQMAYTVYCNKDAEEPINLCDGTRIKPARRLVITPAHEHAEYREGRRQTRRMVPPVSGTYDDFLQILAKCMGWRLVIEDAN